MLDYQPLLAQAFEREEGGYLSVRMHMKGGHSCFSCAWIFFPFQMPTMQAALKPPDTGDG